MDCEFEAKQEIQEGLVIKIIDNSQKRGTKRQVVYHPSNHVVYCSSKMFEFEGIPYGQILCILKGKSLYDGQGTIF